MGLAAFAAMVLSMSGCGDDSDADAAEVVTETVAPSTTAPTGPTFLESDTCRAAAELVLADGETAAAGATSDQVRQYAVLVRRSATSVPECSEPAKAALVTAGTQLELYAQAFEVCEISASFFEGTLGDGTCPAGDQSIQRPFVRANQAIDDARAVISAQQ